MRYIVTFKDNHVAHFMKHEDRNQIHLLACTPEWKPTHVSGWTEQTLKSALSVKFVKQVFPHEIHNNRSSINT